LEQAAIAAPPRHNHFTIIQEMADENWLDTKVDFACCCS